MDKLEEIIKLQTQFMDLLGTPRLYNDGLAPQSLDNSSASAGIQQKIPHFMFALTCELGEIGDELNWKSWKKTRKPVNMDNVRMEFIDALHFLLEMMIMCGMDAEMIHNEYKKKMEENLQRQKNGY